MENSIDISGLVKKFGSVTAVNRIDLKVGAGEIYGLLGPNGAGKTTTIRVLLGYLNPTSGTATVLGGQARDLSIRSRIGYLPGDLRMDPKLTVAQTLDWYAGLRGNVDPARIRELCDLLKLDSNRKLGALSKGNRQKVGVVQAFMHEPDIVVLDEPTAGLDPLMQREVLRLVERRRDAGAAILFSSHIIAEVEEIASRVGILREGVMVVEDTVEGLQEVLGHQTFHIRFHDDVDEAFFAGVAGVDYLQLRGGRRATVWVSGEVTPLLERLSHARVDHLRSDPLALDDVFYGVYDEKMKER